MGRAARAVKSSTLASVNQNRGSKNVKRVVSPRKKLRRNQRFSRAFFTTSIGAVM
jgi:hypothetical protein